MAIARSSRPTGHFKHIEYVQDRAIMGPEEIKHNIHDLLKAAEALLSVTSADVSAARLMLDSLLMFWEAGWYFRLSPVFD